MNWRDPKAQMSVEQRADLFKDEIGQLAISFSASESEDDYIAAKVSLLAAFGHACAAAAERERDAARAALTEITAIDDADPIAQLGQSEEAVRCATFTGLAASIAPMVRVSRALFAQIRNERDEARAALASARQASDGKAKQAEVSIALAEKLVAQRDALLAALREIDERIGSRTEGRAGVAQTIARDAIAAAEGRKG